MPEPLQFFLSLGFAGLMLLLRLDARRFGAAEWDRGSGGWHAWLPRLTWYGAGLGLGLLIFALHPSAVADLHLTIDASRGDALLLGLVYAAAGIAAAFGMAVLTYGRPIFVRPSRYPGGVLTAVGTAYVDEFLFRGVILGALLAMDLPDWLAVVVAALIYVGAIRASAGPRDALVMLLTLGIGLIGGLLVVLTGGLAAGFIGHAASRFAMFVALDGRPLAEPAPVLYQPSRTAATADSQAWVIQPRRRGDDGRGGPLRPA
jgi:membrane protease YdiL (CAAX protease family)